MAITQDTTIDGTVSLDGETFKNVLFHGAKMTYAGGPPPSFDNCRFDQATFSFDGPAGNTLAFLKAMAPANTNMRDVVLALIPELKS